MISEAQVESAHAVAKKKYGCISIESSWKESQFWLPGQLQDDSQSCDTVFKSVALWGARQSGCLLTAVPLHFYSCHWGTAAGVSAALIFHIHQGNYQTKTIQKRTTESTECEHEMAGFRDFFFFFEGKHDMLSSKSSLWLGDWIARWKRTQNCRRWSGSVSSNFSSFFLLPFLTWTNRDLYG